MSPRTLGSHGPSSGSKAFNSLTFGYGGQSAMAPKQEWWTDERIQKTVTKGYILNKLGPEEREQVLNPVSFDGLTDDTYLDWILNKGRRLFLILDTVGLPGQIFRVLNASWDDDDLPLSRDDIQSLKLSEKNDEKLNSRFFTFQHSYCLKETRQGTHTKYEDDEIIPVEFVSKVPTAAPINGWECCRPVSSKRTYVRRRFSVGERSYQISQEEFIDNTIRAKEVEHKHIANIWASYIWRDSGYVMTSFVAEHTLKSFMDQKASQQFQKLAKVERATKLQEWINCLSYAVKKLHERGWAHTEIRPSNVLVDANNNVAFSDIGSLTMFQTDKKRDDQEVYNYSPPENFSSSVPMPPVSQYRESKISTTSSSGSSSHSNRSSSSTDFFRSFSQRSHAPPSPPLSDISEASPSGSPTDHREIQMLRSPEKADIFSLGCIFLDILTYVMEGKLGGFLKQRSSKRKNSVSLPSSSITSAPSVKSSSSKTDNSFHANLGKVETWIRHLNDESCEYDETVYRGVPRLLKLVRSMLSPNPHLRPSAQHVCERVSEALKMHSGIQRPHCYDIPTSQESEEEKRRKSEAESIASRRYPSLNATNLFRLKNASIGGVDLQKQTPASYPPLRDSVPTSIPPSPPRTESPVSPVSTDGLGIVGERRLSAIDPTYDFITASVPSTSSPSRSAPQYSPRSVPHPVSSSTTSFLSSSPQSMMQQPMQRSVSSVSSNSMDPLGIIQEYSKADFPHGPYASPAMGFVPNPAPRLEPAMNMLHRAATSPSTRSHSTMGLQRAPSTSSSASSTMAIPPVPTRPVGPTTVPPPTPASSISSGPTYTTSPMSSYSFMPIQQASRYTPSPAPIEAHSNFPHAQMQALSLAPIDALPTIPPRRSSTRVRATAPVPPPTSELPPVPNPPPSTALPEIPPSPHAVHPRPHPYAPQLSPSSYLGPRPAPPVPPPASSHPAFQQSKSAPDAVPQLPGTSSLPPPHNSPDAPQIPLKSPRRNRAFSHARSSSDLLMDDALTAWKGAARTPEQMQRSTFVSSSEMMDARLEERERERERVDSDLGTLSGGGLGADGWRDYYIHVL